MPIRTGKPLRTLLLTVGWLGSILAPAPASRGADDETVHVYRAARIWPGEGEPIARGLLVVKGGKVVSIAPADEAEIPAGAVVHDLGPAQIVPGLVAAETGLGRVSSDDERTITPEVRAVEGFDFFGEYDAPLSGGVTTAQVSPGRSRIFPGRGAVVKLAGGDPGQRSLRVEDDLILALTADALNAPRIYLPPARVISRDNPVEPTRPQPGSSLASAVSAVRALIDASRSKADAEPESTGFFDASLEALANGTAAGSTLRVRAGRAAETRAALDLAREYDLGVILIGPAEVASWLSRPEAWQGRLKGVILTPRLRPGRITDPPLPNPDVRATRPAWEDAAALLKAGIPTVLSPESDEDLTELLFLGGLMTQGGLAPAQVLEMLTLAPARLLGVDGRVGSLAPGKDADFVVLNGEPFDLHTRIDGVYVAGARERGPADQPRGLVIRAARIEAKPGEIIEGGSIAIEGGKIRGLGPDVSAPADAETRVFEGAYITPGFLDLSADLGLGGPLSSSSPAPEPIEADAGPRGRRGPPDDEPTQQPSQFGGSTSVGLDTRLGDRLVSDDPSVALARQGGVTTVLTGPRGQGPGPLVAFKLGDDPVVLRDPVAIRFSLSGTLPTSLAAARRALGQGKSYADSWTKYEEELTAYEAKKKEYDAAKAKYDADLKAAEAKKAEEAKKVEEAKKEDEAKKDEEAKKEDEAKKNEETKKDEGAPKEDEAKTAEDKKTDAPKEGEAKTAEGDKPKAPEEPKEPKKPTENKALEPYRALFAGKIPALVDARRLDAIRAAVALFRDDNKLNLVLLNADEAFRAVDLLAEKDVKVVVGPTLIREVERRTINLAQIFAGRGIPFGFQSESSTGVRELPLAVRFAARKGLGTSDALAGLTTHPAEFLGLSDRVGQLAPGRDADLVVWSGPPFALSSRVLAVMINGRWVYEAASADQAGEE